MFKTKCLRDYLGLEVVCNGLRESSLRAFPIPKPTFRPSGPERLRTYMAFSPQNRPSEDCNDAYPLEKRDNTLRSICLRSLHIIVLHVASAAIATKTIIVQISRSFRFSY